MSDSTADLAPLTPEELEEARKIAEKEARSNSPRTMVGVVARAST